MRYYRKKGENMDDLKKLLRANIAKMNILEAELENTQALLVNIYSCGRKNGEALNKVRNNFKNMRELFDGEIKRIYQTNKNKGERL